MNQSEIIRSDDLRAENRHRILRTLRQQGSITRAKAGTLTGLSQAALSTLFSSMIEQGLAISSSESGKALKRGRPLTSVSLNAHAARAVTVSLTMNRLTVCLVDYAGDTLKRQIIELDTKQLSEPEINNAIVNAITSTLDGITDEPNIQGISVGFQGVTDSIAGDLLWSPILSVDRLPICHTLEKIFNVPVTVNNDCNLISKALHNSQSNKLGDSFAAVLFSHGVGLGLYLSGVPFSGPQSSALELGHIQYERDGALCRCGKSGCIEAYASDYGIMRTAKSLPQNEVYPKLISDKEIDKLIKAADGGNAQAALAFSTAGKAIGSGLATVFTLLDPMPVALVGHNTGAVNLMKIEIQRCLEAAGRSPKDFTDLIHCYHDDSSLLHNGLVLDAMATLDRGFAHNTNNVLSAELS